jgi:diguanylate cyclase (GGDEF)-like protein
MSAPRRSWLRKVASSWVLVALGLAMLTGAGWVTVATLSEQANHQALASATEEARVITSVTVARDVATNDLHHRLRARQTADLDGDVRQLGGSGHLLGLAVLRRNGQVVYHEGSPPVPEVSVLRQKGVFRGHTSAWFQPLTSSKLESGRQIQVLLPLVVGSGQRPQFAVVVGLPVQKFLGGATAASRKLSAAIVTSLALLAVGLIVLRRRLKRREYRATHDALTGLGNRDLLDTAIRARIAIGQPFALALIDVNGFKRINDSLGYAAGDDVLVQLAQALGAQVRGEDLLVRLGADEFAVLLPGITETSAFVATDRLFGVGQDEFVARGVQLDVEASLGLALAPQHGRTIDELLRAAGLAKDRAKRGGLGGALYAADDDVVSTSELDLLVELRTAIERGDLRLHYQPTVALRPGVEPMVEALVRWQHPVHGLVQPDQFIPLAEVTALIHPLTEWVLDEAARQCAEWRLDGLDVRVAVNISPRSLAHDGLVGLVTDTLSRHQLPAAALHLEVTESAILGRPDLAREILGELRSRGISIAIDDFGAGYTSLAHLRTMPVDVLKIDRCFIRNLLQEPHDQTIAAAIITLAHGLGLIVVAEGVEDEATMQYLDVLGCDIAQGYHISRPNPGPEITAWLRRHPVVPTPPAKAAGGRRRAVKPR